MKFVVIFLMVMFGVFCSPVASAQSSPSSLLTDCENGDVISCFNVGLDLYNGDGIRKDIPRAGSMFQKGCDGGHAASCFNLGQFYYDGIGVESDKAKAATLFSKGCEGGYAASCFNWGNSNFKGEGRPRNFAEAKTAFEKACAGNIAEGCRLAKFLGSAGPTEVALATSAEQESTSIAPDPALPVNSSASGQTTAFNILGVELYMLAGTAVGILEDAGYSCKLDGSFASFDQVVDARLRNTYESGSGGPSWPANHKCTKPPYSKIDLSYTRSMEGSRVSVIVMKFAIGITDLPLLNQRLVEKYGVPTVKPVIGGSPTAKVTFWCRFRDTRNQCTGDVLTFQDSIASSHWLSLTKPWQYNDFEEQVAKRVKELSPKKDVADF